MKTALHNKIMRRVYYSYALSISEHSMFWQGIVLGACVAAFGRLTHVASIFHNLSLVPLGGVPRFIENTFLHALAQGELLTVLVVLGMVGLSLSFIWRAIPLLVPQKFAV